MGKCELGDFHMYAMLWNTQKFGGTHIKGQLGILLTILLFSFLFHYTF